jgi:serine/threonine-protein kinase RIM15
LLFTRLVAGDFIMDRLETTLSPQRPNNASSEVQNSLLLPPKPAAVAQMKAAAAAEAHGKIKMERTISEDIREQREDLREAATAPSAVVDLSLEGVVRWISPSWQQVVGTEIHTVLGKPISDIIRSESHDVFEKALEAIRKDDARSQNIRFTVVMGPSCTEYKKRLRRNGGDHAAESLDDEETLLELEGQGIMVYDRSTGNESHVSGHLHICHC